MQIPSLFVQDTSQGGSQDLTSIINYMRFVNENWMYPGDQAAEIRDPNPIGEGYLCPILVFCELTNSHSKLTPASRAGYHFVSGRISLCKSKRYFGSHAGTHGLIKLSDMDVKMSIEDKQRICIAWDWMKENHPLIKDLDIEEPSDLTNATETLLEEAEMTEQGVDMTRLSACHMGPVGTRGLTTADESNNLGYLTIGLLGRGQKVVKYSSPCLLGYLFPTLYPRGQGFYSLDYDGVKRENVDQIEVYDESMDDNWTYRNDEVEGGSEEYVFSSEDERSESKPDDCTDDTRDDDDLADQEQLADSDSVEDDTDIESDISDSEGTL
ncbi:hypothetical protein FBU30_006183 [Linnemannia zychae]|nr:hypothetical protein FBU30_006183 [Linnemannia zychae]